MRFGTITSSRPAETVTSTGLALLQGLPSGRVLLQDRAGRLIGRLGSRPAQPQTRALELALRLRDGQAAQVRHAHRVPGGAAEQGGPQREGPPPRSRIAATIPAQTHGDGFLRSGSTGSGAAIAVGTGPIMAVAAAVRSDRCGDHARGGSDRGPGEHPLDVLPELGRGLVAVVGVLGQRLEDDGVDRSGTAGSICDGGTGFSLTCW